MATDFKTLDSEIQELIQAAIEVKKNAYCPYSNFHVGAAVLCKDGKMVAGCNVENASYGLSICAERSAITSAVAEGYTQFKAVAMSCDIKDSFKGPCGACRQFIIEFGLDISIYIVKPDMTVLKVISGDMLPMSFTPATLAAERV
ncbi:hypothetical protein ScPMuIL_007878 [Solemya velum]